MSHVTINFETLQRTILPPALKNKRTCFNCLFHSFIIIKVLAIQVRRMLLGAKSGLQGYVLKGCPSCVYRESAALTNFHIDCTLQLPNGLWLKVVGLNEVRHENFHQMKLTRSRTLTVNHCIRQYTSLTRRWMSTTKTCLQSKNKTLTLLSSRRVV